MALATNLFTPTTSKLNLNPPSVHYPHPRLSLRSLSISLTSLHHTNRRVSLLPALSFGYNHSPPPHYLFLPAFSSGDNHPPPPYGGGNNNDDGGGGGGENHPPPPPYGGGNKNDDDDGGGDNAEERNREEAMLVLAEVKRSLESLPGDLVGAIQGGRIPGAVIRRYLELENSGFVKWLLQFGGLRQRLLADDLFFVKVAFECGVGVFTKTAAKYERRRENFFKELEIVFADVVTAVIADSMLVYLSAPTVSLQSALAVSAGPIARFFHSCPENAFQLALPGTSYSLLQRLGAIARNGAKLFAVGMTSSLVGTFITNFLINAKKAVDEDSAGEIENVPLVYTSVAYGVYMAVSSNPRYQLLAGVVEQRILEPLFRQHKLMLSAFCFAVRTVNKFFGPLLYARWIGIQKAQEEQKESLASQSLGKRVPQSITSSTTEINIRIGSNTVQIGPNAQVGGDIILC